METQKNVVWFDSFTRNMLLTAGFLLCMVFSTVFYMNQHAMTGEGTDDKVNDMAGQTAQHEHHPFINLPGDSQLSAFQIADLFAGIIIGWNWRKFTTEVLPEKKEQA